MPRIWTAGIAATAMAGAALAATLAFAQDGANGPEFDRENAAVTWSHPAYDSAEAQYEARKAAAGGGSDAPPADIDWTGIYENARFQGYQFSLRPGEERTGRGLSTKTTMKLTPLYAAEFEMRMRATDEGVDFDPLSWCLPAGFTRWPSSLFFREYAPLKGTTFLIKESANEIRRIYTDGRGHMDPEFAYPRWDGDSIGFWDGDVLVVWTTNIKGNMTGRDQPALSDELQSYEEWQKVADDVIRLKATFYDPLALEEPFDFIRYYQKVDDEGGSLRALFDACNENQNVVRTAEGGSDFSYVPGVDDDVPNLSDAETWLKFDEAREAGLVEEYEQKAMQEQ